MIRSAEGETGSSPQAARAAASTRTGALRTARSLLAARAGSDSCSWSGARARMRRRIAVPSRSGVVSPYELRATLGRRRVLHRFLRLRTDTRAPEGVWSGKEVWG